MRTSTSGLRNSCSDVLPLSYRDCGKPGHYEISNVARVLHTLSEQRQGSSQQHQAGRRQVERYFFRYIVNCNWKVTYHLLVLSTMTPLSMEKESVGRPAIFHALILMAWPNVLLSEKSSEQGMFLDWMTKKEKISINKRHITIYAGRDSKHPGNTKF